MRDNAEWGPTEVYELIINWAETASKAALLQCRIISVGFVRGYVCWTSTVQITQTGLFANNNHLYMAVHPFFASLLAKGTDESTLARGLRWNRSVLIKMIFWLLGIPMTLNNQTCRALLIASLASICSHKWKWSALIPILNINKLWSVCVWERAGIIWIVGAGRRLAWGYRGSATREASPTLSLVC